MAQSSSGWDLTTNIIISADTIGEPDNLELKSGLQPENPF